MSIRRIHPVPVDGNKIPVYSVLSVFEFVCMDEATDNLSYILYTDIDGRWLLAKIEKVGNITTRLWYRGDTGYAAAWADRANKTYSYLSEIF